MLQSQLQYPFPQNMSHIQNNMSPIQNNTSHIQNFSKYKIMHQSLNKTIKYNQVPKYYQLYDYLCQMIH
jgi:hypothetical protein